MASSLFTACKKNNDSNNTDQLADLGKATITGRVYARLVDTIGANGAQVAPANTVITAWIDTRDLVVNPTGGAYAKRYYTASVDSSGNYKLVVDVSKNQPATVTILPQQFQYNQVRQTNGIIHPDSIYKAQKTYSPGFTSPVSAYNGLTAIQDISYQ